MEMPFWVENFEISGSNAFAFRLDIFLHLLGQNCPPLRLLSREAEVVVTAELANS